MGMYEIIRKKRDGMVLSQEELASWINGYVAGKIPDYQSAALLMAAFIRGLNEQETVDLTMAMLHSGDIMGLSFIPGIKADKHSTGGVGDKSTLIVAPVAAAAGLIVAKMSGRGLGHTGGTLDKLESIPGFRTGLSVEEFLENVRRHGISVIGQTKQLAPADALLYALRDVTATVDSIPLIAASIMSKKLALGSDTIVLDVKYGSGAFMKVAADAIALAKTMVAIGEALGKRTAALITSMEQPLGNAVGNALEVREAIQVLQGEGPDDLRQLSCALAGEMILQSGLLAKRDECIMLAQEKINDGSALNKFMEMVAAQGGDTAVVQNPALLPQAKETLPVLAPEAGFIKSIDAESVGFAALNLGAGRHTKEEKIDPAVGIVFTHKSGDYVQKEEKIADIYCQTLLAGRRARNILQKAVDISSAPAQPKPLIYGLVTKEGFEPYRQ